MINKMQEIYKKLEIEAKKVVLPLLSIGYEFRKTNTYDNYIEVFDSEKNQSIKFNLKNNTIHICDYDKSYFYTLTFKQIEKIKETIDRLNGEDNE